MEKILWPLVVGFVGAYIAKKRKLNPFFWFAICFALGIVGLVGLFFLPYFKKSSRKQPYDSLPKAPKPPLFSPETLWYYLDAAEAQAGPVSFLRLQELKQNGLIQENTYIWTDSFSDWKPWEEVFPQEEKA